MTPAPQPVPADAPSEPTDSTAGHAPTSEQPLPESGNDEAGREADISGPRREADDGPGLEAGHDDPGWEAAEADRGDRDRDEAGSGAQPSADSDLSGALEAILMVVDEPVSEVTLAQILEVPTEQVTETLTRLAEEYTAQGRGFELRQAAGGWRLYTRPEYAPYVERFVLDGQQTRLTQAALETLAVIAYKQPVTRSRVSAIRGVNCDGVIRTLLTRGLIEERGVEPETGAHLYGTTKLFLEKLGLNSVDELPPLAPFLPEDVEALADGNE